MEDSNTWEKFINEVAKPTYNVFFIDTYFVIFILPRLASSLRDKVNFVTDL